MLIVPPNASSTTNGGAGTMRNGCASHSTSQCAAVSRAAPRGGLAAFRRAVAAGRREAEDAALARAQGALSGLGGGGGGAALPQLRHQERLPRLLRRARPLAEPELSERRRRER